MVPPIVAIALALITKEVYSSLFIGIVLGGLMYSNYNFSGTVDAVVNNGLISAVADGAGIFIFLVILGIIVSLVNKAGGSQAFGRWAATHIKSKAGACIATFLLGVLIFIDDYFNCLTVGSVMRPLTDSKKVSRVKLAYLIDATAAPVCMIAPISSWAAAVSGCVDSAQYTGLQLFVKAIPFNFYSLLTLVFVVAISLMGFDYGKMSGFEIKAEHGDLIGNTEGVTSCEEVPATERGRVLDLIFPVIVLIIACIIGLIYAGGFFGGACSGDFIAAFANTDAFVGLPWGGIISLIIIVIYMIARRVLTFKECMQCVPQGFIAMVPAILILTMATSLKSMTTLLGAKFYVAGLLPGLCHRHELGHLRHLDSHRHEYLPGDEPASVCRRFGLSGRCGLRRPLLPHLGHDDHVLRRCPVQPRRPRGDAAALRHHRRGHLLCLLPAVGFCPQRMDHAPHRRRTDRRHPVCHPQHPPQKGGLLIETIKISIPSSLRTGGDFSTRQ